MGDGEGVRADGSLNYSAGRTVAGRQVRVPHTACGGPSRGQFLYQLSFLLGRGCPRESSFACASRFAQGLEWPSVWAFQEGQREAWRQKRCREVRAATSAEQKLNPGVEPSGQGTHLCHF